MSIIQAGSASALSQTVPGFNVVIQQPGVVLNGAPTNTLAMVGAASWGPKNTPVVFSGTADGSAAWGPVTNRTFDMMTHVSVSALQGCQSFIGVRVTDGTDTAAAFGLLTGGGPAMSVGSVYTGVVGNATVFTLTAGTATSSIKVTVTNSLLNVIETFDSIPMGATGQASWGSICSAINNGNASRGPSALMVATNISVTAATQPALNGFGYILAGGTDGASALTAAMLIGVDSTARTGMYALRKQPASVLDLVDMTDWTQASVVAAFTAQEGWYGVIGGAAGQTLTAATAASSAAGYGVKLVMGDWLYWVDAVNGVTRLVNPAAFVAGELATLDPNQSSLNKPLTGIVGSQRAGLASTGQSATFSSAEKQVLFLAGVDLVANPSPGGSFWAVARGINASGAQATNGDNYTRMIGFLCNTLSGGMGLYIGVPITTTLFGQVRATLLGLLSNCVQQGYLDATYGTPYAVTCDTTNNPQTRTGLGYLQADVQVRFESIVLFLNVNLAAGQTVVIASTGS
jgi:hypothetical protein